MELEEVKIKENVIVVGELKFTLPKKWCFDSCITGEDLKNSYTKFILLIVNPNGAGGHNVPALFSEGYY